MWSFNNKLMEVNSCLASIMNLFLLHKLTSKNCLKFQIDYAGIESDQPPRDPM